MGAVMTRERTSFYSEYLGKTVTIVAKSGTVCALTLGAPLDQRRSGSATDIIRACQAYLAGERINLQQYPFHMEGLTAFERAVLETTRQIPRGHTTTYSALAANVGRPRAARAVGNALAKNPAPLFVPCHRVIGVGGVGGFSCGLDVKAKLLKLEGVALS